MTMVQHNYQSSSRTNYRPSRQRQQSNNSGGQFFLGNIDKALKREEVYDFLTRYEYQQGRRLYVSRFDMPKVTVGGTDSHGRPINCAGYAFVHVKDIRMARAMLAKKTVRIGNLQAEIKPYDQAKRDQSTQRHIERSKQTSAAASIAGDFENEVGTLPFVEDWTIEHADEYADVHHAVMNSKIGMLEKPENESAYVSETEDNISMSSHHQFEEHASMSSVRQSPMPPMRAQQTKVKPSPVKLDDEISINAVMKQMHADDITPTVERINERLMKFQAEQTAQQQQHMTEIPEHQMNPIRETSTTPLPELNAATQKTNLILADSQVQQQTNTTSALPALLHQAPATLYQVPVVQQSVLQTLPVPAQPPQQQQPIHPLYNYQNSPYYHSINDACGHLLATGSHDMNAHFNELKQQWLQYYQQNPALAIQHFHMTADNYNQALVERVTETLTQ